MKKKIGQWRYCVQKIYNGHSNFLQEFLIWRLRKEGDLTAVESICPVTGPKVKALEIARLLMGKKQNGPWRYSVQKTPNYKSGRYLQEFRVSRTRKEGNLLATEPVCDVLGPRYKALEICRILNRHANTSKKGN